MLRGAGDGQNLREHPIATAGRLISSRALRPLMAGLGREPEVASRFTGLVGPDTNWRDELDGMRPRRDGEPQ